MTLWSLFQERSSGMREPQLTYRQVYRGIFVVSDGWGCPVSVSPLGKRFWVVKESKQVTNW